jgi:hypothetical protein
VAVWISQKSPATQLVAIAPGVYVPYNPAVKNLSVYLENPSGLYGDCTVIKYFWPNSSYSCDSGILPGSEEPPQ